jgi:hypothetical protein
MQLRLHDHLRSNKLGDNTREKLCIEDYNQQSEPYPARELLRSPR